MRVILVAVLLPGLAGCANFRPPASIHQLQANSRYWVSYDSSRRGAWIATDAAGSIKSCAEPAPDVALSFNTGLKGSVEAGGAKVSGIDASAVATAAALAGRDNVVLLAREALFGDHLLFGPNKYIIARSSVSVNRSQWEISTSRR
jgi:hypothetical protein